MTFHEMQIRRVQMTGKSSYILTLPKEWIVSIGIKKNEPLGMIIKDCGDLIITANIEGNFAQRETVITLECDANPVYVFRSLVGTYIGGFTRIEIKSVDTIPISIKKAIHDFVDQVIGFEVVEETNVRILLRDLINPLEMPFAMLIRRMYLIARGMQIDSAEALLLHDNSLAQDIIIRDQDVDRIHWLVSRYTNIIMQNYQNNEHVPISLDEIMHFYQTSRIIERFADHAVLIATCIQNFDINQLTEETKEIIKITLQDTVKLFDSCLSVFFSNDTRGANRIIESVHHYEDNFKTINNEIMRFPTDIAISIRNISDSIHRTSEYSADIAEEVINYCMKIEKDIDNSFMEATREKLF
jgi:phosphate uptake regulator